MSRQALLVLASLTLAGCLLARPIHSAPNPPKLTIHTHVINDSGGTSTAPNWIATVASSNNGSGRGTYVGNEAGVVVTLQNGKQYSVTVAGPSGYTQSQTGTCAIASATQGASYVCTFVENDDQPPPPPQLTMAQPQDVSAQSATGSPIAVTFPLPTVSGGVPPIMEACAPSSGSIFQIGPTTVMCSATDSISQQAQKSFTVTVTATPPGDVLAASCNQADVQHAVDIALNGERVLIPAGTCTWATTTSLHPAVLISGKGVTLKGAGVGVTVIKDHTTSSYNETAIVVENSAQFSTRITGLTFSLEVTDHTEGEIKVTGDTHSLRIDHCAFDNAGGATGNAIAIGNDTYGLIDHNTFTRADAGNYKALQILGDGVSSWNLALAFGTANALYVEDNTFTQNVTDGSHAYRVMDNAVGGRVVFRYNTLNNTGDVGSHGYDSDPHAMVSYEIYNNVFNHSVAGSFYTAIAFRGGTGVIFNNTMNNLLGGWNNFINLYYYCSCPTDCSHPTQNVYPGLDQPGFGPSGGGGQVSAPIYEWNNTVNNNPTMATGGTCAAEATMVQLNRDYFRGTQKPGYTPYVYPHPLSTP